MSDSDQDKHAGVNFTHLTVRRTIRASPERLFAAWTEPEQLMKWWGPTGVVCVAAEVDLHVGGKYRIGNRMPNQDLVWIVGAFELIQYPNELRYSWQIASIDQPAERVRVRFVRSGLDTEVIVEHEKILDPELRAGHAQGWVACLAGLEEFLSLSPR